MWDKSQASVSSEGPVQPARHSGGLGQSLRLFRTPSPSQLMEQGDQGSHEPQPSSIHKHTKVRVTVYRAMTECVSLCVLQCVCVYRCSRCRYTALSVFCICLEAPHTVVHRYRNTSWFSASLPHHTGCYRRTKTTRETK